MDSQITVLLNRLAAGDRSQVTLLYRLVEPELRDIARRVLSGESPELQPTMLVDDAFMQLVKGARRESGSQHHWEARGFFYAFAAKVMRQQVRQWARRQQAQKRGGLAKTVSLSGEMAILVDGNPGSALLLDEAFDGLEREYPDAWQVACQSVYLGCTHAQIAANLQISMHQSKTRWKLARGWLRRHLGGDRTA